MAGQTYIAVVDVGKTNKKVLIFDQRLQLVDSAYQGFEEYVEDSVHLEDLEGMTAWILNQLKTFAATYRIGVISVTTHGATLVCVDRDNNVAVPPVAYTTDPGEQFQERFYAQCGDPTQLQQRTATPRFSLLLNAGKTLQFVKERYPGKFDNVDAILGMPQYFGAVLTGKRGAEPTYAGCHTYLLDFGSKRYSSVTDALGVRDRLPPLAENSWSVLGTVSEAVAAQTGLSTDCIVTMGIHDSNSSLLPYLVKGYDNFVLNSTGTWCVAMHPMREVSFGPDELGKLVLYNLDAFFNPVKTTIFMGGQEFDTYTAILKELNGRDDFPAFDEALCARIVAERKLFVLPSVVKGTGLFPDSPPRVVEGDTTYALADIQSGAAVPEFFRDFETAYTVLNLSLAAQTKFALGMAGFDGRGSVFTEGGFRKNGSYNAIVSAMYGESQVSTTRLEEATAFGAAMLAKAALDGTTPLDTKDLFEIEMIEIAKPNVPGLGEYIDAFHGRVGERG
ncbi:MAG: carbohydrate kinase [Chitinivibrionales bacterium]|nr:carbohydrate kinase [Chitinivibrionales bacterium]